MPLRQSIPDPKRGGIRLNRGLTRAGTGYGPGAMLRTCEADGCTTLTFGPLCLAHEPPAAPRRFPRGRPYALRDREVTEALRRIGQAWPLARQGSPHSLSAS